MKQSKWNAAYTTGEKFNTEPVFEVGDLVRHLYSDEVFEVLAVEPPCQCGYGFPFAVGKSKKDQSIKVIRPALVQAK